MCTNEACKATHVIIPDFLNPYKRYVGSEIESSIDKTVSQPLTDAEESTIRRWNRQFTERLPKIISVLVALLIIEYENMLSLLDCIHGLSRLRRILALFPYRNHSTVLGLANLKLFYGNSLIYF
jgi:hypothetical protein